MGRARYEISLLASVEIEKTKLSSLYGLLYDMMGYRPAGNLVVFIILYLLIAISSFFIPSVVPLLGLDLKFMSPPAQFFFDRYRSI